MHSNAHLIQAQQDLDSLYQKDPKNFKSLFIQMYDHKLKCEKYRLLVASSSAAMCLLFLNFLRLYDSAFLITMCLCCQFLIQAIRARRAKKDYSKLIRFAVDRALLNDLVLGYTKNPLLKTLRTESLKPALSEAAKHCEQAKRPLSGLDIVVAASCTKR